jgi:hypothetical protein
LGSRTFRALPRTAVIAGTAVAAWSLLRLKLRGPPPYGRGRRAFDDDPLAGPLTPAMGDAIGEAVAAAVQAYAVPSASSASTYGRGQSSARAIRARVSGETAVGSPRRMARSVAMVGPSRFSTSAQARPSSSRRSSIASLSRSRPGDISATFPPSADRRLTPKISARNRYLIGNAGPRRVVRSPESAMMTCDLRKSSLWSDA